MMFGDRFEWAEAKALANLAKHRVSFEAATGAFEDPFAIELLDDRADYGEVRMILIGVAAGRLTTIAYTLRNERFRVISARFAEPRERRAYHEPDQD